MKENKKRIIATTTTIVFLLMLSNAAIYAQTIGTGNLVGYVYGADNTTPISGAVVKVKNINNGMIYKSYLTDSKGFFSIKGLNEGIYIIGITTTQGEFNSDNLIGIKENQTANVSFSINPYDKEVSDAVTDLYSDQAPEKVKERRIYKQAANKSIYEVRIGKVINYIPETGEAAVYIGLGYLQLGDEIRVKGYVTNFLQDVKRLTFDNVSVKRAFPGQTPLIGVEQNVEIGDFVYLVCGKTKITTFFRAPAGMASLLAGAGALFFGAITSTTDEPEESAFKNKK